MTQQKTWQERFDNLFNAIGYDHIDTCTCPPFSDKECYCISGRQQLKFLISQILEEERDRIVNGIIEIQEKYGVTYPPHMDKTNLIINLIKNNENKR